MQSFLPDLEINLQAYYPTFVEKDCVTHQHQVTGPTCYRRTW